MIFTANLPPETPKSGPTFRDWGANSWWQNTRLPYWPMAAAGDFDNFATILEFYLQTVPFNSARTREYFNHDGIFYTETKTMFGAYSPADYGPAASTRGAGPPAALPVWLESNPYIHLDFGGDAGGPEVALMALEHYLYTGDEDAARRYLPLVNLTLAFFAQHYNRTADGGQLDIFPTQALETYWCLDGANGTNKPPFGPWDRSHCPANDHPTVAGLRVLCERAQRLPDAVLGAGRAAATRARWAALLDALPPVPLTVEDGLTTVAPYEGYARGQGPAANIRNCETPELYSTHPFRYFTLGTHLLGAKRDLTPSQVCANGTSTRQTCRNVEQNGGWTQGILNAALLGDTAMASRMLLERANTQPAKGYRFPGFAPHEQDYEPSADHFANMQAAMQWMLLQPADDGEGSALLFASWPCAWDVRFSLRAPRATTVAGELRGGKLVSLAVTPAERRDAIVVVNCGGS